MGVQHSGRPKPKPSNRAVSQPYQEDEDDDDDNAADERQLVRYEAKRGKASKKRKPRKKRQDFDSDDSDDSQPKRKTKTVEVEIPVDWSSFKHHVLVYVIEDLLGASKKRMEEWCEYVKPLNCLIRSTC